MMDTYVKVSNVTLYADLPSGDIEPIHSFEPLCSIGLFDFVVIVYNFGFAF